jgi:hypothetical protein
VGILQKRVMQPSPGIVMLHRATDNLQKGIANCTHPSIPTLGDLNLSIATPEPP